MTAIILAAPDLAVEPSLVAAAGPAGLTVLRRCVDASDLLACAAAEPNAAVVLSAGVPRLSGDLIARMNPASRQVIALVVSDQDEAQLRSWGVPTVVRLREVPATMSALAAVLDQQTIEPDTRGRSPDGVFDTGVWTTSESGIVICVWGPPGAPGRTCRHCTGRSARTPTRGMRTTARSPSACTTCSGSPGTTPRLPTFASCS
ncbi:MAG: hypothetical protein ACKOE2_09355, partial [Actinomycetales bacterium]